VVSASSHPDTLILPAFAADAAANVGGISAVLEVVSAACFSGPTDAPTETGAS
jgi:hypothetical protein